MRVSRKSESHGLRPYHLTWGCSARGISTRGISRPVQETGPSPIGNDLFCVFLKVCGPFRNISTNRAVYVESHFLFSTSAARRRGQRSPSQRKESTRISGSAIHLRTCICESLRWPIVMFVRQYPPRVTFRIVVLARPESPEERGKPQSAQKQRNWNQDDQNVQCLTSAAAR